LIAQKILADVDQRQITDPQTCEREDGQNVQNKEHGKRHAARAKPDQECITGVPPG
jgi:hypothetical protein